MDEETEMLVERWILTFCEMPPLLDAKLMRRILEEHGAQAIRTIGERPACRAGQDA